MNYAISAKHVNFTYYRSDQSILKDVTFKVPSGTVYGLLGRNGSGKSTLLHILSTLLLPADYRRDSITINGKDIRVSRKAIRNETALISGGERGLYYNLTGMDNLKFFGSLYGLSGKALKDRILCTSKSVGIDHALDKLVRKYSLGMKQRLHIAAGLLNDPSVILMDEPTNGLDVEITNDVLNIIKSLKQQGKTILLTTHHLSDAEKVCDEVSILSYGKIIFSKSQEQLRSMISKRSYYKVLFSHVDENDLVNAQSLLNIRLDDTRLRLLIGEAQEYGLEKIVDLFSHSNIVSIQYERPSLEDLYLQEVRRSDAIRN